MIACESGSCSPDEDGWIEPSSEKKRMVSTIAPLSRKVASGSFINHQTNQLKPPERCSASFPEVLGAGGLATLLGCLRRPAEAGLSLPPAPLWLDELLSAGWSTCFLLFVSHYTHGAPTSGKRTGHQGAVEKAVAARRLTPAS